MLYIVPVKFAAMVKCLHELDIDPILSKKWMYGMSVQRIWYNLKDISEDRHAVSYL